MPTTSRQSTLPSHQAGSTPTPSKYNYLFPKTKLNLSYSGNYDNLYTSVYFWFCMPIAFALCLLPKYLAKSYKYAYLPDDIDILRWTRKIDPQHDFEHDPKVGGRLKDQATWSPLSPVSTNQSDDGQSQAPPRRSLQGYRPSTDARGSQTDMSTGARATTSRGFSFSMEEGGVAMRRVQSRLSERHQSRVSLPAAISEESAIKKRRGSISLFPSLRKSMRIPRSTSPGPVVAPGPSSYTPPSPPR